MWNAPIALAPVRGVVEIPGSKSITNRALVLAALADGESVLTGVLRSRDTDLMMQALRDLGVTVKVLGDRATGTTVRVNPSEMYGCAVNCGLAGTLMRFLPPVAALALGASRFDGDPVARTRPQREIVEALRELGADIEGDNLPLIVRGRGQVRGGAVTIDASRSSQFISGLLLSAPRFDLGIELRHRASRPGAGLPSAPHVDMTVAMLRENGVEVLTPAETSEPNAWTVLPGTIRAIDRTIEPDLSNATPFLAAAAATGGEVLIPHWPLETTQPGSAFADILVRMGAEVEVTSRGLLARGPKRLRGIRIDLHDVGELTPSVAALAALAEGPSRLTGIAHLRGHETDRLRALATEINLLGGDVKETDDGLEIRPRPLTGGVWHAYADHRMATAGAIIGTTVPGVLVDDIDSTAKTLPGFADLWVPLIRADEVPAGAPAPR